MAIHLHLRGDDMTYLCYCNRVLPGKEAHIEEHWKKKNALWHERDPAPAKELAKATGHTAFHGWLQRTPQGSFYLHYLEAPCFDHAFKGLREQILAGNPLAQHLHTFYKEVLGRDYLDPQTEPQVELLLELSLPSPTAFTKRKASCWPIQKDQEQAHRDFRKQCRTDKRRQHESIMSALGITRLSSWIQTTPEGLFMVNYSEHLPQHEELLKKAKQSELSKEHEEIASSLDRHTGLSGEQRFPDVNWLTQPQPTPLESSKR